MVISGTLYMIDGFTIALWWQNLGKSGQSMCAVTSRHSCGENRMVKGSIQGVSCNF